MRTEQKPEFAMKGLDAGQLNAGVVILGGEDGFLQLLRREVLVVHGRDEYKPLPGPGMGIAPAAIAMLAAGVTNENLVISTPREMGFNEKGYLGGGVPRVEFYREAYHVHKLGFCTPVDVMWKRLTTPPHNHVHWIHVAMTPIPGPDGRLRVLGISQDAMGPCLATTFTSPFEDVLQLDDEMIFRRLTDEEYPDASIKSFLDQEARAKAAAEFVTTKPCADPNAVLG